MSVGMTKFYRWLLPGDRRASSAQVMWDGIDCHRARMLGWLAESVDDSGAPLHPPSPQGASQKGIWTGGCGAGFGQYFMGTSPLYYLAVAHSRLPQHPVLDRERGHALGLLLQRWSRRAPRYEDAEFRRFVRRYQHLALLVGKRAATRRVNEERAAVWRGPHPAATGGRRSA